MLKRNILGLIGGALLGALTAGPVLANESIVLPKNDFSFNGPFGSIDKAAAQRGYQVYKEVCASCHAMKQMYFRNLEGIGLTAEQVKIVAASYDVATIGDDGQPTERKGLPSDHFKAPYPNEKAARAALNGALPPDLSVIVKARENGPDYVVALMTGYAEPPAGMKMGDGMNYNKFYPGHQIAMVAPLVDGRVDYTDGTKATVRQMATDVVTFLEYAAEPEQETRKRMGIKIVLFLAVLTGLTYVVKRQIWSDVHH